MEFSVNTLAAGERGDWVLGDPYPFKNFGQLCVQAQAALKHRLTGGVLNLAGLNDGFIGSQILALSATAALEDLANSSGSPITSIWLDTTSVTRRELMLAVAGLKSVTRVYIEGRVLPKDIEGLVDELTRAQQAEFAELLLCGTCWHLLASRRPTGPEAFKAGQEATMDPEKFKKDEPVALAEGWEVEPEKAAKIDLKVVHKSVTGVVLCQSDGPLPIVQLHPVFRLDGKYFYAFEPCGLASRRQPAPAAGNVRRSTLEPARAPRYVGGGGRTQPAKPIDLKT